MIIRQIKERQKGIERKYGTKENRENKDRNRGSTIYDSYNGYSLGS